MHSEDRYETMAVVMPFACMQAQTCREMGMPSPKLDPSKRKAEARKHEEQVAQGDVNHVCTCCDGVAVAYARKRGGSNSLELVRDAHARMESKLIGVEEHKAFCWYCKCPASKCKGASNNPSTKECLDRPIWAFMKPPTHH